MSNNHAQFVLMRTDMKSMTPGKAMAQACHASNVLEFNLKTNHEYILWKNQTNDGFGTCFVYGIDCIETMTKIHEEVKNSWLVHDPTYPIRDGKITHYLPINTCLIIFGDINETKALLKKYALKLHK